VANPRRAAADSSARENPTVASVEKSSRRSRVEDAALFGSGMGAIATASRRI
jgi:cystathionine beta-lyase/cystathionine gamma-synthase